MTKNRCKERNMKLPIEKQDTAALANIEEMKKVSNVTIPSEIQTENGKAWVEENEK